MSSFAPTLAGRISRRELALSPHIWLAVGSAFSLFAVACVAIGLFVPEFQRGPMIFHGFVLGAIALALLYLPAPLPDSPLTHVVIGLTYVATAGAMVAAAPYGYMPLPAAIFLGALTAVWLEKRWQFAAHYAASAVVLLLPSILGITDTATLVATLTLLPPTWILGILALHVLEAAEAQSEVFEARSMRDVLTGAGNRRLLDDRLATELAQHRVSRRRLSVLTLDLNGFKEINDTLGHGAGDRLLIETANRLTEVVDEDATVIRQGGDEFCVIAPSTDATAASELARRLATALAPIETEIGIATYPEDGGHPQSLLDAADARLLEAKEATRSSAPGARPAASRPPAELAWLAGPDLPVADQAPVAAAPPVTRKVLGASRELWATTGAVFVFYGVAGLLVTAFAPQIMVGPFLPILLALGCVVGVVLLATTPRPLGSPTSHAIVATSYLFPAAGMVLADPGGAIALAAAVFTGPLIAVRSQTRFEASAHTLAAVSIFFVIAVSGLVDIASSIAILILIVTTTVLAVTCVIVFEAAEAQGRELELMSAVDPLTGLANRRELDRVLNEALAKRDDLSGAVSVLALDLNGFKALNDRVGHSAGDEVLVEVAIRLRAVVGQQGLVARQGGDEFTVILPSAGRDEAAALAVAIRAAVGTLVREGCSVGTGIGVATAPTDGVTGDGLLQAADYDLLEDKYGTPDEALRAS